MTRMIAPPLRIIAVIFAAAAALTSLACSRQDADAVEIEFWAMGREGEIVPLLTKEFEAENPGVLVKVQQIPWTSAHEKLLTAYVGGALPDVAQLGNTWIAEFAELGALADLSDVASSSSGIEDADYFPGIWATNVLDGAVLGVPWYVDTRLLFYRSDILKDAGYDHPPRDWEEWRTAAQAIKARDGAGGFAILLPLNEYEPQVMLALQGADPILRDDGRYGNFSSDGQLRAIDYYLSFFRDGLAPPASQNEIANVWNEFARGYFSFYITGPWNIGEFRRRLPAELQDKWMTAPLPGPAGPGASIAGGSSLVISSKSQRREAAFRLIEFLSRPDIQARFFTLSGNLPPRRSSWNDPALSDDPHIGAFRDQLERVRPAPKIPEWERIAQEIRVVTERAVHDGWDAEHTAAELDRRVDAILEKRRWMMARERGGS